MDEEFPTNMVGKWARTMDSELMTSYGSSLT